MVGDLASGCIVGRYVLGEPLGAGGMGVVYAAESPDGARVAVKLLHPHHLEDPYAVGRFLDEGVAGMVVTHPGVVSVVERGRTDDGAPYLVMPRIDGELLRDRLERDGALPVGRAVGIVRQLLAGLDALHAAGVIHGDVKPDNVLVSTAPDGRDVAVLIDLGLASPRFGPADDADTDDLLVAGTPEYLAPELIRGRTPCPASDLYAAGVILYELLTGSTPFGGGSDAQIVARHLHDDVVPPSLRAPDAAIPPLLDRIVMHALARRPSRRFASAAAYGAALDRLLRRLEPSPRPTAAAAGAATIDLVSRRRHDAHALEMPRAD